jgi:hypothetical protein
MNGRMSRMLNCVKTMTNRAIPSDSFRPKYTVPGRPTCQNILVMHPPPLQSAAVLHPCMHHSLLPNSSIRFFQEC